MFFVQKSLEADRALGLLRLLQDSDGLLEGVGPDDRVAVVSFEHHFKIWLDFTADLERARDVLAWDVMHEDPPVLEPQAGLSIVAGIARAEGRKIWNVEDALRRLGEVLAPLPGSKSVVLIGYGFDHVSTRYGRALDALDAARAAVFSLDVTQADYHTFEHALRDVSHHTGGLFLTTFLYPRRAVERMASAVSGGRYVLFTRVPDLEPGAPIPSTWSCGGATGACSRAARTCTETDGAAGAFPAVFAFPPAPVASPSARGSRSARSGRSRWKPSAGDPGGPRMRN